MERWTNYDHDRQIGKEDLYSYCDCGRRLVTSMEVDRKECSECLDYYKDHGHYEHQNY
uniref:hypothetical protein n=1 Tax=uncultured Dysgonomonas sp. TaxID=206096 RepID=UPI002634BA8D|nr:hypothetical protein [uncultured Dysgonomonas sp.]